MSAKPRRHESTKGSDHDPPLFRSTAVSPVSPSVPIRAPVCPAGSLGESGLLHVTGTMALADAASARTKPRRYAQIISLLRESGWDGRPGLTCHELAAMIGCEPHQISGRLTELRYAGQIVPTGERRPNPRTGSPCDVYAAGPHVTVESCLEAMGSGKARNHEGTEGRR